MSERDDIERVAARHPAIPQDSLPGADMLRFMPEHARDLAALLDDAVDRSDWAAAAIAAENLTAYVDARKTRLVREMRQVGRSWADVAEVLGITRQAAHERYRHVEDPS